MPLAATTSFQLRGFPTNVKFCDWLLFGRRFQILTWMQRDRDSKKSKIKADHSGEDYHIFQTWTTTTTTTHKHHALVLTVTAPGRSGPSSLRPTRARLALVAPAAPRPA